MKSYFRFLSHNGQTKYVDLEPLLKFPMFEELKDKEQFKQFGLDGYYLLGQWC